jgi:hypothetical protein
VRSRKTLSRVALLGVMALVALMLTAAPGNATFAKKYDLSVTPTSLPAGSSAIFAAKYTNKSLYKINSTVLTVPSGFQVTAATTSRGTIPTGGVTGTSVSVKDLNLSYGSSFTISVSATAPCGTGSGSWSALTKTGNFSGSLFSYNNAASARAATVTGSCSLEFVDQPTDSAIGDAINAPDGVSVRALNGASEPVAGVNVSMDKASGPGNLTGNADVATGGEPAKAAFTELALDAAGTYTLSASASGYGSVTSDEFQVAGAILGCDAEGGDSYPTESGGAASAVDLQRETGACDQGIPVTIVVRNNEVEITKPTVEGSAFTMTIEWTEEEFQYPLPPTQIAYDGEETTHAMQQCLPDGPDGDGYPDLPPRVDGPEGNEFWCVTSLSVNELPSGLIEVSESYFGAGDPRVTRG